MSEQPLGISEEITEPITESELFDWSSDLRLGAGRKLDRERLTRALAEVRRLREYKHAYENELPAAMRKIEEQATEIERLEKRISILLEAALEARADAEYSET